MASITIYPKAIFTDFSGKIIIATDVEFAPGFCLTAGDKFLQFAEAEPRVVREEFHRHLKIGKLRFYLNTGVSDEISDDFPLVSIDGLMVASENAKAEAYAEIIAEVLKAR